ncbi:nucleoside 2-deoxyribosyltransferase [Guptibacillus algicola]|uniref:nucleoside 2-deoxyribosyltransferase n=1 Tax=Guptibacillus algicola TaxID=225844 RepID=UPI001CD6268D|nr:nucleoside 2-deoxyribosyltransferase [Alkalihalobacillus algicola]MCA0987078.1 nucleoside 2-deoxyribosyltransferase [Alkalihalobacillus algicola]
MKFYIASSFQNKAQVQELRDLLKGEGFVHTYDWTLNERAATFSDLEKIGSAELDAVRDSDFLVVLLPGGKGTHIEMGIALGLDIPVYLYTEEKITDPVTSSSFYHTSGVTVCTGTLTDLLNTIVREKKHASI